MNLSQALYDYYGLQNVSITVGPRQFVAETFVVQKTSGHRYFCKVVDKPLFIAKIIASLPALVAMHEAGFARINYPIKTTEGSLYLLVDDTLVVLYNYIDAPQSYDYDVRGLGRLIGKLHSVISRITTNIKQESFTFAYKAEFEELYRRILQGQQVDDVLTMLQVLLRDRESELARYFAVLNEVLSACRENHFELVITHGDAGGNVLVKAPDDIYIVDWDEILLAPRERDLWIMNTDLDFMSGYREIYPGYEIDPLAYDFYVSSQYFYYLHYYLTEIVSEKVAAYRMQKLEELRQYFDGWIRSHIKSVYERYSSDSV
ncbi:MAG: aminoglycoside phosphotransferase family protein [Chloroflexi bacterium]|nr:aminoglycoside phosphotransferase family protein [Chloroflexota bacterium]